MAAGLKNFSLVFYGYFQIDTELDTRAGHVIGSKHATGHSLLVDVRFELPYGKRVMLSQRVIMI